MAEVSITINGRHYGISCEDGQEARVRDLGHYVDARLKDIARAGAANSEAHLLVLTTLLLADEIFDLRNDVSYLDAQVRQTEEVRNEEGALVGAIEQIAERIEKVAGRIQNA